MKAYVRPQVDYVNLVRNILHVTPKARPNRFAIMSGVPLQTMLIFVFSHLNV